MAPTTINNIIKLVEAYWTPERLALWAEYKKTDCSITFREFEKIHQKEKTT